MFVLKTAKTHKILWADNEFFFFFFFYTDDARTHHCDYSVNFFSLMCILTTALVTKELTYLHHGAGPFLRS